MGRSGLLVCLLVIAVALVGCSGSQPTPTVGIVGDSITYLSEPSIAVALRGMDYDVQAIEGRTIAAMTPLMESRIIEAPGGPPHSMVINLGTNDIVRANPDWLRAWDALMADTSRIPCEVLFTINPFVSSYVHGDGPTVEDVNGAIDRARAADPARVHIIDWGAAVLANHEAIAAAQARGTPLPPPLIRADGIHPTAAGQRWIGQHIEMALVDDCRE